ncbi:DUF4124 domain-containing protein [Niveibacterium sp. SC-1]|uniref:DUF4124 domain-containing protein n=1 Tax=Niveibacterium sp. SC-1 TaxID=3135646 RepID=UPI00312022A0
MTPRSLLLPVLLLTTGNAYADIFKCTDPASGRVTYTNSKVGEKGCELLSKDQAVSTVPNRNGGSSAKSATPTDFPRVDSNTQRSRDNDRRRILETELDNERQLLADAKKELADQEAVRNGGEKNYARVQERLKPFQDKVGLHERNIAAIEKEIGNLR